MGFLFTQVSGRSLDKMLKVLDISKLQDNFYVYWCEIYMPSVHLRSKVSWKSQSGCNILSTIIHLIPCQSAIPFLRYDFFKIWSWKSKVKVMGDGNIESHKVGVSSYRITYLSFHANRPFHSWDTAFSKFDLENPRSRSNGHDVA